LKGKVSASYGLTHSVQIQHPTMRYQRLDKYRR
jgi:hypothetical protein